MAEGGESGVDPHPARADAEMMHAHRDMPAGYLAPLYRVPVIG
jgi:hypothetical protein